MGWCFIRVANHEAVIDKINAMIEKETSAANAVAGGSNAGNGEVLVPSASDLSVAESWTLTCTSAGGDDQAVFSVSGSVSGARDSATSGQVYSVDEISFVISAGDTDWSVGDTFTIAIAGSAKQWEVLSNDPVSRETIFKGIGNGANEILGGLRIMEDSTYWNIEVAGFRGYDPISPFEGNVGYAARWMTANNDQTDLFVSFDSYHITFMTAPVQGTHCVATVGFLNPLAVPEQNNYPLFVGANSASSTTTIGNGSNFYVSPSNGLLWYPDSIEAPTIMIPRTPHNFGSHLVGPDSPLRTHPAIPLTSVSGVQGEIRGIVWPNQIDPDNGLISALSVITEDNDGSTNVYFTSRNINSTAAGSIAGMKMEQG